MANSILARSRSLLLRSIKSEIVSLAAHESDVWACPFGILPLGKGTSFPLEDGDMYGYLRCIGCLDLGDYRSRRPRFRPNTNCDFSTHRGLVGWMESADIRLGILWRSVVVNCFLTGLHVHIREKPVDDEAYRSQSEPKGHRPCSNKMAEVRLIDIRKVAHARPSTTLGLKACPAIQCLNSLWPVNSMEIPRSFAASITS